MNAKTIFIIAVTVLVTVVLMNNTEPVTFWFFGEFQLSKLTFLSILFATVFLLGFLARGKRKRLEQEFTIEKATHSAPMDDDFDEGYSDENYIK